MEHSSKILHNFYLTSVKDLPLSSDHWTVRFGLKFTPKFPELPHLSQISTQISAALLSFLYMGERLRQYEGPMASTNFDRSEFSDGTLFPAVQTAKTLGSAILQDREFQSMLIILGIKAAYTLVYDTR